MARPQDSGADAGYVLHRRRYRESSLIVDFLTRNHGRVGAVARGALRPHSRLAANLQPSVPLALDFAGRSELLTLRRAEASGTALVITGERLYCLLYINELIVRLTAAHDPNVQLFDLYGETLAVLAGDAPLPPLLRRFEMRLLTVLGLGMDLSRTADDGEPVAPERQYRYVVERGVMAGAGAGQPVRGSTLLGLAGEAALGPDDMREARTLMRQVLDHHLEGRPLASRKLFARGRTA
jgi:DNA repair protein RecO (recombination protein O)